MESDTIPPLKKGTVNFWIWVLQFAADNAGKCPTVYSKIFLQSRTLWSKLISNAPPCAAKFLFNGSANHYIPTGSKWWGGWPWKTHVSRSHIGCVCTEDLELTMNRVWFKLSVHTMLKTSMAKTNSWGSFGQSHSAESNLPCSVVVREINPQATLLGLRMQKWQRGHKSMRLQHLCHGIHHDQQWVRLCGCISQS